MGARVEMGGSWTTTLSPSSSTRSSPGLLSLDACSKSQNRGYFHGNCDWMDINLCVCALFLLNWGCDSINVNDTGSSMWMTQAALWVKLHVLVFLLFIYLFNKKYSSVRWLRRLNLLHGLMKYCCMVLCCPEVSLNAHPALNSICGLVGND